MLSDELVVLDVASPLWGALRPLLDHALQLERNDDTYAWHGWRKQQITAFLAQLPAHCSLLAGVWREEPTGVETLALGCVCEILNGQIHSLRTFQALANPDLPPLEQLEPGYSHALELMRAARIQVAPVAWALFTDQTTWNEWMYADDEQGQEIDKGEFLAELGRQGRCVLLSQQRGPKGPSASALVHSGGEECDTTTDNSTIHVQR